MLSSVALFAIGALAAPAPESAPEHIAYTRANTYDPRSNGEVDHLSLMSSIGKTLSKYGASHLMSKEMMEKRATVSEPLTDQVNQGQDTLYYGPLSVGGQQFTIDFDTGSADLFVPGPQCGQAQGCIAGEQYDQGGVDEMNTTSITYGSGQVKGENYLDTVCFKSLCAPMTNVISLTQAQGFSTSASQGLMGMGFSTIANSKMPTFFERLMAMNKVTYPEFSFYLGRASSGTQGNSQLTMGGRDHTKFTGVANNNANKVTRQGYWQIKLDGAGVGTPLPASAGQAAIDTGTTIILAPTGAARAIFSQIPGARAAPLISSPGMTFYTYPCGTQSIPSITFGGKKYSINANDFNLGTLTAGFKEMLDDTNMVDDGLGDGLGGLGDPLGGLLGGAAGQRCVAAIVGADLDPTQNLYVVGDTFLKSWYSIYNYKNGGTVRFGKAK